MEMVPATVEVECNFFYNGNGEVKKYLITWDKITEVIPLTYHHFRVPFDNQQAIILRGINAFIVWYDLIIKQFLLPQFFNVRYGMERYKKYCEHYGYPDFIKITISTMKPSNVQNFPLPSVSYLGRINLVDNGDLKANDDGFFKYENSICLGLKSNAKVPLYYHVNVPFNYPVMYPKSSVMNEVPKKAVNDYNLRSRRKFMA